MATYHPVLIGESPELRAGIEAGLSLQESSIEDRIAELDRATKALGMWATFGAEIEYQFVDDPCAEVTTSKDKDLLHEEVIGAVQGYPVSRPWKKGQVIFPMDNPEPIMVTYYHEGSYNSDQSDSDISEVRTAPAGALEALDRYWRTIQAIGSVAAANGRMGMVLSTHLSGAGVYCAPHLDFGFLDFSRQLGDDVLAAAQHNLNALYCLQVYSGLETGIVVQEAFADSKDVSTAVHRRRIERRHPFMGVVDPRVDMLAVLDGVHQAASGQIPPEVMRGLRKCRKVSAQVPMEPQAAKIISDLTLYDIKAGKLVIPASLERTSRSKGFDDILNAFIRKVTADEHTDYLEGGSWVLRTIINALRISEYNLTVDVPAAGRWGEHMRDMLKEAYVGFGPFRARVVPEAMFDSPTAHIDRRRNLAYSSTARRILGAALPTVTEANESVARRQEVIDKHMVVLAADAD